MDKSAELEEQNDQLAQSSKSIQLIAHEISGPGIQSAAELLAEIGDVKRLNDREKLTLYCGIGALNHSSGKSINAIKPTKGQPQVFWLEEFIYYNPLSVD